MAFGNKIKKLRKEKKFSQEEFAKQVGLSPNHISKIENNKLIPYAHAVKKIAEVLNISTDYLLFDDVPKNTDLSRFNDSDLVDLIFKVDALSQKERDAAKLLLKALVTNAKAENLFK